MLARTNQINHPRGASIQTPILVPSFSSKGFTFDKDELSEATDALKISKEFLTEILLISAYDLYHNHIPYSEEFLPTDLTIIDSGGYETSDVYDLSASAKYSYPVKDWEQLNYESIIDAWPAHKAGIIVSYDHGKERFSLEEQIANAKDLFDKYPDFLTDFLIKPETTSQRYVQIDMVLDKVDQLKDFTVIGVTEKELGNSILERMLRIARIRRKMDDTGVSSPIHIFGSLDPITSVLYFFAGAEIFDGLTWLKYSYFKGTAIYQTNYGALHAELGIHTRDVKVRSKSIVNNIYSLDKIKYLMKDFAATKNFDLFDSIEPGLGSSFRQFYKTFEANLK